MASAPSIDADAARQVLQQHLRRCVGDVEFVGAGEWSRCFGFTVDGRGLVARFGPHVDDFEKDRRAGLLAGPALPVPEVLFVGDAPGGHVAISTRGYGEPLETLPRSGWEAVLPSLFATLDAARSIDLSSNSGSGPWGADGVGSHPTWRDCLLAVGDDPPEGRTPGWRRRLGDSFVGDRTFRAGLARLEELVEACPDERHLVHADLLHGNVLVRGGRIDAVFDWGCSLYGDHLYDLAGLHFWSAWYPYLAAVDVRGAAVDHFESIGLDVTDLEARLLACELHIGLGGLAYSAYSGHDSLGWIDDRLAALL